MKLPKVTVGSLAYCLLVVFAGCSLVALNIILLHYKKFANIIAIFCLNLVFSSLLAEKSVTKVVWVALAGLLPVSIAYIYDGDSGGILVFMVSALVILGVPLVLQRFRWNKTEPPH